ncbi:hypothetical protein SKAU_G00177400 [Synaphobranchus kaupii]|uniref:Uncharacterized protein n=1 Tax=Synaphobranchus kaupii TaxID=118154 RepID=A0A9Q1J1C1_SYNKA|nr:hypothetical protein SKAU_G00177400 [Synaphobranchus kaupii]
MGGVLSSSGEKAGRAPNGERTGRFRRPGSDSPPPRFTANNAQRGERIGPRRTGGGKSFSLHSIRGDKVSHLKPGDELTLAS